MVWHILRNGETEKMGKKKIKWMLLGAMDKLEQIKINAEFRYVQSDGRYQK